MGDELTDRILESPGMRKLDDAVGRKLAAQQRPKITSPHQLPVIPRDSFDYEGIAQAVRESAHAKETAKRDRENRMIDALEEVRREL